MKKLYVDEHNSLKNCEEGQKASHILLTANEYDVLTFSLDSLKRINRERSNSERG